jgi:lysophospholipase L1-like esterase
MGISGFGAFSMVGTLKSFVVTSSALTDNQHNSIVDSLYYSYNLNSNINADTVIAFGDSNTTGQGAASYVLAVSASLGLAYKQLGIAGSLFTSSGGSTSGFLRYPTQVVYNPYNDYLVIQYGTNDILSAVNSATYSTQFNSMIADLISKGWNVDRICLCSVPYQLDNANAAKLDDYRTVVSNAATLYGTRYFDLLQAMRDGGANLLLNDAVHLNTDGQTVWSNGVIAAFSS